MEFNGTSCDVCSTHKKETNHWLVSITRPGFEGIIFQPAEAVELPRNPLFIYENLCGAKCSLIRLDRYMDELRAIFTTLDEGKNND